MPKPRSLAGSRCEFFQFCFDGTHFWHSPPWSLGIILLWCRGPSIEPPWCGETLASWMVVRLIVKEITDYLLTLLLFSCYYYLLLFYCYYYFYYFIFIISDYFLICWQKQGTAAKYSLIRVKSSFILKFLLWSTYHVYYNFVMNFIIYIINSCLPSFLRPVPSKDTQKPPPLRSGHIYMKDAHSAESNEK